MAKTQSAKKAVRSSARKQTHNLFWKKQVKEALADLKKNLSVKDVDTGILNAKLVTFQKTLDKASKEKVLHKNKANRLKSAYAKKISAKSVKTEKPRKQSKPAK